MENHSAERLAARLHVLKTEGAGSDPRGVRDKSQPRAKQRYLHNHEWKSGGK